MWYGELNIIKEKLGKYYFKIVILVKKMGVLKAVWKPVKSSDLYGIA